MALPQITSDLKIIQKLDDYPNDVGGLSADELKAKFDEAGETIAEYLNETLLPAITAENTPFASTDGIKADTVQAAIMALYSQLQGLVLGAIPNGSVTLVKLADDVRTTLTNLAEKDTEIAESVDTLSTQLATIIGILNEEIAKKQNKATANLYTLLATNWTQDVTAGLYTQTLLVSGVKEDTAVVIVDVQLPTNAAARDTILDAWNAGAGIYPVTQGNGTLKFYADEAPTVNIPINVGVL